MHKHLTWTDRLKIEQGLREGLKPIKIAARLHVHNSTIYRELRRGTYTHLNSDLTTEERYSPEIAQQRYEDNLSAKGGDLKIGHEGTDFREMTDEYIQRVEAWINDYPRECLGFETAEARFAELTGAAA